MTARAWTPERIAEVRKLYEGALPAWQRGAFGMMAGLAATHLPDALAEIERLTAEIATMRAARPALTEEEARAWAERISGLYPSEIATALGAASRGEVPPENGGKPC